MVKIENLKVELGDFSLGPVNIEVKKGEFFIVLGPTGAGKTILLETIVGVYTPSSGSIYLDGRDVTKTPPESRDVSIVYQDFSLFPHLSVKENIAYGLKVKGRKDEEKVLEMARLLFIEPLLDRMPGTLSGGEKQRVALARALVVDPSVVLMDEPFSSLDFNTKLSLRKLVKDINKKLRKTFIMVTHDIEEALSLGDRIAVFKDGLLEQVGHPKEIVENPASPFVASLLGVKNIFPAELEGGFAVTEKGLKIAVRGNPKGRGFIAIKPDEILLSKSPVATSARNVLEGMVLDVVELGGYVEVVVNVSGETFFVHITKHSKDELALKRGDKVFLVFKALSTKVIL